jgi:transposase
MKSIHLSQNNFIFCEGGVRKVEGLKMYAEVHRLHALKFNNSAIGRKLGLDRKTVRKYLKMSMDDFIQWKSSLATRKRTLDDHKELILSWIKEHRDITGAQVFDWLKERFPDDIQVSESATREYVRLLREDYDLPKILTAQRCFEAVKDPPMGHQMQVDFGEIKVVDSDGRKVRLHFICFVLSHSRYKFLYWLNRHFTTQDVILAHELCFEYFEGMPAEAVYDQDSLLLIDENYGELILTEAFHSYVKSKKLKIFMCRKADPMTKGRVERVVGFIKINFAKNRTFTNIDSWNRQALNWLERTGNDKEHGSTKKRPVEVFALEKQYLKPIFSVEPVQSTDLIITRVITKDNTVNYKSNRYTVPKGSYNQYQGREITVSIVDDRTMNIFSPEGKLLANHKISTLKGQLVQDRSHTRDWDSGIDDLFNKTCGYFSDKGLALSFVKRIKERFSRNIRDQLELIIDVAQESQRQHLDFTLEECAKRSLYAATEFKDMLAHIKSQRGQEAQLRLAVAEIKFIEEFGSKAISPYPDEESRIQRELDMYLAILGGEESEYDH